jgi:quercetin dioxygenase-like cupin family protein
VAYRAVGLIRSVGLRDGGSSLPQAPDTAFAVVEIITRSDALHGDVVQNRSTFNGDVHIKMIRELTEPGIGRINVVRFEPGVRNAWHAHSGGQVLHVIEGECLFQIEGGDIAVLQVGDSVFSEPGETHWHGASDSTRMAHLAITFGQTTLSSTFD